VMWQLVVVAVAHGPVGTTSTSCVVIPIPTECRLPFVFAFTISIELFIVHWPLAIRT
jgi:hypothetical protein